MITWYLARGAGLAALVLLSTTTALGALASRRSEPGGRYLLQYVHRAAAGLGLLALSVHLTAVLSDSYAHVGWRGALVPFASGYRPGWVALGTLAAYLFVGVSVLGLARGRIAASPLGARTWRGLHALAYLGWAAAIGHGFTAGTDSEATWVRALYVICLAGVAGSVGVRLTRDTRPTRGAHSTGGAPLRQVSRDHDPRSHDPRRDVVTSAQGASR